jgi:hypothetical protein
MTNFRLYDVQRFFFKFRKELPIPATVSMEDLFRL